MIRALVFDLDGLILDTESVVYASWESTYRSHGVPLPLDLWHLAIGSDETHFEPLAYLLERRPGLDVEALHAQRRFVRDRLLAQLAPCAGVRERIAEARARSAPRRGVELGARVGRASPRAPGPARALLGAALPRGRAAREAGSRAVPRRARGDRCTARTGGGVRGFAQRRSGRRRGRDALRRNSGPDDARALLRRGASAPRVARRPLARRDPRAVPA